MCNTPTTKFSQMIVGSVSDVERRRCDASLWSDMTFPAKVAKGMIGVNGGR